MPPKRGCWATIIIGRLAWGFAAVFFSGCRAGYIFGSGTTTLAISVIFGSKASWSWGSWAKASRTRALAEISGVTGLIGAWATTVAGAGTDAWICPMPAAGAAEAWGGVTLVSNTMRSGNFRSEWIRTGG